MRHSCPSARPTSVQRPGSRRQPRPEPCHVPQRHQEWSSGLACAGELTDGAGRRDLPRVMQSVGTSAGKGTTVPWVPA